MPNTIIRWFKNLVFAYAPKFEIKLEEIEKLPDIENLIEELYNFDIEYNKKECKSLKELYF